MIAFSRYRDADFSGYRAVGQRASLHDMLSRASSAMMTFRLAITIQTCIVMIEQSNTGSMLVVAG